MENGHVDGKYFKMDVDIITRWVYVLKAICVKTGGCLHGLAGKPSVGGMGLGEEGVMEWAVGEIEVRRLLVALKYASILCSFFLSYCPWFCASKTAGQEDPMGNPPWYVF